MHVMDINNMHDRRYQQCNDINNSQYWYQQCELSQAARQGLALLIASAVVVLKHETSTLRQFTTKAQFYINWFQI